MNLSALSQRQSYSNTHLSLVAGALLGGVALAQISPSRTPEVLAGLPIGAALLAGVMKSGTA